MSSCLLGREYNVYSIETRSVILQFLAEQSVSKAAPVVCFYQASFKGVLHLIFGEIAQLGA